MSGFPYQDQIDVYYQQKQKEVGEWMTQYTSKLKKITVEQRAELLSYAEHMTFTNAGLANAYIQSLDTVGKRDKNRIYTYLSQVDWFPEGINTGVLDGKIVSRILPSPLERFLGDKDWKSKKE